MEREQCGVCNGVGRGMIIGPLQFLRWHEVSGAEDCAAYLPLLRTVQVGWPHGH